MQPEPNSEPNLIIPSDPNPFFSPNDNPKNWSEYARDYKERKKVLGKIREAEQFHLLNEDISNFPDDIQNQYNNLKEQLKNNNFFSDQIIGQIEAKKYRRENDVPYFEDLLIKTNNEKKNIIDEMEYLRMEYLIIPKGGKKKRSRRRTSRRRKNFKRKLIKKKPL